MLTKIVTAIYRCKFSDLVPNLLIILKLIELISKLNVYVKITIAQGSYMVAKVIAYTI